MYYFNTTLKFTPSFPQSLKFCTKYDYTFEPPLFHLSKFLTHSTTHLYHQPFIYLNPLILQRFIINITLKFTPSFPQFFKFALSRITHSNQHFINLSNFALSRTLTLVSEFEILII